MFGDKSMKVTVLGKYGPYAGNGGGTSSYLVRGENTSLMLDFGSGAMGRLQKYVALSELDAIILSHLHYDHICDLFPLGYYLQACDMRIKLIMPDTDCVQNKILSDFGTFDIVPVSQNMQVGEFKLNFEKMRHPLESYSVKVTNGSRSLFYSGDTVFCDELMRAASGSSLMILDCGKADGTKAPHLSLSEAAFIAKTLQTPAIASHINPAVSYKSPSGFVTVAEEDKTYML